jgi:hypothetical protein
MIVFIHELYHKDITGKDSNMDSQSKKDRLFKTKDTKVKIKHLTNGKDFILNRMVKWKGPLFAFTYQGYIHSSHLE